ncbi:hypothetical protein N2152v2_010472 [Parachlorella kessleri]
MLLWAVRVAPPQGRRRQQFPAVEPVVDLGASAKASHAEKIIRTTTERAEDELLGETSLAAQSGGSSSSGGRGSNASLGMVATKEAGKVGDDPEAAVEAAASAIMAAAEASESLAAGGAAATTGGKQQSSAAQGAAATLDLPGAADSTEEKDAASGGASGRSNSSSSSSKGGKSQGRVSDMASKGQARSTEAASETALGADSSSQARSKYLRWIRQDLSLWQRSGITRMMISTALWRVSECNKCGWEGCQEEETPNWLRFQIVNGSLWAEFNKPPAKGHYPAEYGRGWLSAKGRIPYALLAIIDVLRSYPGQVPDVEGVINTADEPCVPRKFEIVGETPMRRLQAEAAVGAEAAPSMLSRQPPPLFSYNSHAERADLPFPDYSFWGHEVNMIDDEQGHWVYGWEEQLQHLSRKWAQPVREKVPRMVWRGRTNHHIRDVLRRNFTECPEWFKGRGDTATVALFNMWDEEGIESLDSVCRFRYQVYLQSNAWSTNFKQKVACGSVVVVPSMDYYEFWTRALEPGRHYVALKTGDKLAMCLDVAEKVHAMNAFLDQQQSSNSSVTLPASTSSQQQGQLKSAMRELSAEMGAVPEGDQLLAGQHPGTKAGAAGSSRGMGVGRRRLLLELDGSYFEHTQQLGPEHLTAEEGGSTARRQQQERQYEQEPSSMWAGRGASVLREGRHRRGHVRPQQQQHLQDAQHLHVLKGVAGVEAGWWQQQQEQRVRGEQELGPLRRRQFLQTNDGGSGASDGIVGSSGRHGENKYPWESAMTPQEIADEGRKFLREHLRAEDVRLYLRDLLQEYGKLLKFQPKPSQGAVCYSGPRLLQMFGSPHPEDRDDVAEKYPWLASWEPGCPPSQPT